MFLLALIQGSLSSAQTWERITPSGTAPPLLEGHTAVYAPDRGIMMVYGRPAGRGDSVSSGEFWRFRFPKEPGDSPTWVKEKPRPDPAHGAPAGRAFHSAVYDPRNDRMIIFGGSLPASGCWPRRMGPATAFRKMVIERDPENKAETLYDAERFVLSIIAPLCSQISFSLLVLLSIDFPPGIPLLENLQDGIFLRSFCTF